MQNPLTSHILDTAKGKPAVGIKAELFFHSGAGTELKKIGEDESNADGRLGGLLKDPELFVPGIYTLRFWVEAYQSGFFPYIDIHFKVDDPKQHYHIPLLLSPFSFSSYRGS